jgi:hypothetical protein
MMTKNNKLYAVRIEKADERRQKFVDFFFDKSETGAEARRLVRILPSYSNPQVLIAGESEIDSSRGGFYHPVCLSLQIESHKFCPANTRPLLYVNFWTEAILSDGTIDTDVGDNFFLAIVQEFENILQENGFTKVEWEVKK